MTGTNTKVRSIFLTVLMVLSVFAGTVAFAGSAAAASSANLTLGNETAGEDGVTYTQVQNTTSSDDLKYIKVEFRANDASGSPDLSGVFTDDVTLLLNGSEYTDSFSLESKDESADVVRFKLQNGVTLSGETNVTVTIGDVVNSETANVQYTYVTTLENRNSAPITSATDTYTLNPANTGGGGGATDQDPPYEVGDGDASWDTGTVRWTGQQLFYQSYNDSNATYELYEVETVGSTDVRGDFVKEVVLTNNGSTLVNTGNLQGEYIIVAPNGSRTITNASGQVTGTSTTQNVPDDESVVIQKQTLDVDIDEDSITQGDNVSVDITSNRGNYMLSVTSPDVSDSEVAEVFGSNTIKVNGDGTYTFNTTTDAPTGNITFNFDVKDTSASDSDFLSINKRTGSQIQFPSTFVSQERGDNLTFTVETQRGGSALLHVGDSDVNYNATMRVNDIDDDGEVTIEWSTYLAGQLKGEEDRAYSAIGNDTVTQVKLETKEVNGRLAAGDYDLELFNLAGDTQDLAVATLTERSTDNATQHVAPGAADTSNVSLTQDAAVASEDVAIGDKAVTQFTVSGIYGYAASEADLADGSDDGVTVTIEQPEADTNVAPKEIEYTSDENAGDAIQFHFDEDNNQFYVVVDTKSARASQGTESNIKLKPGETYNVTFEINGDVNEYVPAGETETATAQFTVEEPTAQFDTVIDKDTSDRAADPGNITVEAADNQTISGTTNVAPGTEMTIRVTSEDAPILKSNSTVVQDDGTFSATFNFSKVSPETQFTAAIPGQGFENDAATPGLVAPAPSATVSISNQTSDGTTAVVDSVSLSDGGFVTIHDGTLLDGDTFASVRGTSAYLEPGNYSGVEVTLDEPYSETGTAIAMPHLDTNGNEAYDFVTSDGAEDGPYTDEEGAVTDDATLTVSTPSPTPSPSPSPTPSPTPSPSPTPEPQSQSTPSPSPTPTQGQPGFGFAVAIVALAGAALLALRRD